MEFSALKTDGAAEAGAMQKQQNQTETRPACWPACCTGATSHFGLNSASSYFY
jgi:hypothetical protein